MAPDPGNIISDGMLGVVPQQKIRRNEENKKDKNSHSNNDSTPNLLIRILVTLLSRPGCFGQRHDRYYRRL